MSKEETEKMYAAQCQICLLAENMKTCETCPFNIKKQEKQLE